MSPCYAPAVDGSSVRRLDVALHEVVHAGAEPIQVRAGAHAGECRGVEFMRRRLRERGRRLLRPLDAAARREDLVEPQYLARQAAFAGAREEAADPRAIGARRMFERVREDECPLAFPEIAVDLLA